MSTASKKPRQPQLSQAGLRPMLQWEAIDHQGRPRQVAVPGELTLTVKVDGQEIITLMTLGTNPEELALGYLRNQRLLTRIEDVEAVQVDWSRNTAEVTTRQGRGIPDLDLKLARVTVATSGGRGTPFSGLLEKLSHEKLPRVRVRQSAIYEVLQAVATHNRIYRQTGSVHMFGLCRRGKGARGGRGGRVVMCVEDVGRHNAADAIAGRMWLDGLTGRDKILFTTGRLSSEMVMKTALMGIPVLVSKSGATQMGLEVAREVGMIVFGRAQASRFLVYNGGDRVDFDAVPRPDLS